MADVLKYLAGFTGLAAVLHVLAHLTPVTAFIFHVGAVIVALLLYRRNKE